MCHLNKKIFGKAQPDRPAETSAGLSISEKDALERQIRNLKKRLWRNRRLLDVVFIICVTAMIFIGEGKKKSKPQTFYQGERGKVVQCLYQGDSILCEEPLSFLKGRHVSLAFNKTTLPPEQALQAVMDAEEQLFENGALTVEKKVLSN